TMLLFTPAALFLCSGLVVVETLLTQEISVTRRAGQRASISCGGIDSCYSNTLVIWYQKRNTGTFERLLGIGTSDRRTFSFSHRQENDFSVEIQQNTCNLILRSSDVSHTASYYCSCYTYSSTFGPGTRLTVSGAALVPPVVHVYPAASL
uniref:Ig-like domain-containing protein n=1 Tax=Tetraodon nigroviridis TaxID=99883 RepID=H3C081_TETNG